jgi:hypothetical protein
MKKRLSTTIALNLLIGLAELLAPFTGYASDDCKNSPMQIYDAAFDFLPGWTAGKNPNGCWTYGWTTDLSGAFHIYPQASISPLDNNPQQWIDPANNLGQSPDVKRNQNGDFDNGNVTYLAGALLLTGCGTDGHSYSHVIWTAPKKGRYLVSTIFYAQQNGISADVHILLKGRQVFSTSFTQNGEQAEFVDIFSLKAGDKIDFASGPNGQFFLHPANVGLDAQVISLKLNDEDEN